MAKPTEEGGEEKIRTTKNRNWRKELRAKARAKARDAKRERLRRARKEKDDHCG